MSIQLSESALRLVDGANYAVLATVNPDGSPQTSVVWVKREGDVAVFTTTRQRKKGRNLMRDPRISVTLVDPEDPYTHVEIRGRAELTDDPPNALGTELSHKYLGVDPPPDPEWAERVQVRVQPEHVV